MDENEQDTEKYQCRRFFVPGNPRALEISNTDDGSCVNVCLVKYNGNIENVPSSGDKIKYLNPKRPKTGNFDTKDKVVPVIEELFSSGEVKVVADDEIPDLFVARK